MQFMDIDGSYNSFESTLKWVEPHGGRIRKSVEAGKCMEISGSLWKSVGLNNGPMELPVEVRGKFRGSFTSSKEAGSFEYLARTSVEVLTIIASFHGSFH